MFMCHFNRMTLGAVAGAAVLAVAGVCPAKETHQVTISYLVGPAQPLPEGLQAVAVIDSGVATEGMQQDEREQKWSLIAADMIEAMLQAGGAMMDPPLSVAKRRDTRAVLVEHDLAMAGMVQGEQAVQAGKLLAVQGLITSRITVRVDEQRARKSSIDWVGLMGGVLGDSRRDSRPPPGPPPPNPRAGEIRRGPDGRLYRVQRTPPVYRNDPARLYDPRMRPRGSRERGGGLGSMGLKNGEVEEISRSLTVQCSFSLIDVGNGRAILQHSPPPYQKHDKASPDFFFGNLMGEKELDPVDHFIGELVERATREFVSMLVPTRMEVACEVIGHGKEGEQAVRALRGDDYETAMRLFQESFRDDDEEPDTVFAMGVVSELMGRPDQGLEFYRKGLMMEDLGKDDAGPFLEAKNRLTRDLPRIMPPGANPPPAVEPPPPPEPLPDQPPPATEPAPQSQAPPSGPRTPPVFFTDSAETGKE